MVELILSPFKLPGARETLMPKPDDHNYNETNSLYYIYTLHKKVYTLKFKQCHNSKYVS